MSDTAAELSPSLPSVRALQASSAEALASAGAAASAAASSTLTELAALHASVDALLLGAGVPVPLVAAALPAAAAASLMLAALAQPPPDERLFLRYDPAATARAFAARPVASLTRGLVVAYYAGGFFLSLRLDKFFGREEAAQPERALHLRNALTALGPAFVKIGQVLSSRVDLLPSAYLAELRLLQDAVPPFPEPQARAILEAELPPGALAVLSATPVASASLGQVYKARRNGHATTGHWGEM